MGTGDWGLGTGEKFLPFLPYMPKTLLLKSLQLSQLQTKNEISKLNSLTYHLSPVNSHQQGQFWQMGLMIKIENW